MSDRSKLLTNVTWRIVEARGRRERQREVLKLAKDGAAQIEAEALLMVIQRTIEYLEADRRRIAASKEGSDIPEQVTAQEKAAH